MHWHLGVITYITPHPLLLQHSNTLQLLLRQQALVEPVHRPLVAHRVAIASCQQLFQYLFLVARVFAVELEDERERAAHAAESARGKGGGDVKAVMPGVVVDVLVAEGDEVEEGQALLILEAMKMQNEIGAPGDGIVKALHTSAGDAVGAGDKLVTLAAPEAE